MIVNNFPIIDHLHLLSPSSSSKARCPVHLPKPSSTSLSHNPVLMSPDRAGWLVHYLWFALFLQYEALFPQHIFLLHSQFKHFPFNILKLSTPVLTTSGSLVWRWAHVTACVKFPLISHLCVGFIWVLQVLLTVKNMQVDGLVALNHL